MKSINQIPFNKILEEVSKVNSEIRKYEEQIIKEDDWGKIVDKYWFRCNKCNQWFYKEYRQFIRNDKGVCTDCKGLRINWNLDKVKKYCKSIGSLFLSQIWNMSNDKYKFACTRCGREIERTFTKFHSGQTLCDICAYKVVAEKTSKTHQEYLQELVSNNIDIVPLEEYKGDKNAIKHKCPKCGREDWEAIPGNILSGKSKSCMGCRESEGEEIIHKYLVENNINFKREHKFEDLKSIINDHYFLRFDFAIFINNKIYMLIEYDGQHHFEPVNFGGISDERALKNFKITQQSDKIKNEYCKNNNIKLERIPYWEINDIENVLNKILNIN